MSLNPSLQAGLHLGDRSVGRMNAKQRWGMHGEEFPLRVLWKAAAPGYDCAFPVSGLPLAAPELGIAWKREAGLAFYCC